MTLPTGTRIEVLGYSGDQHVTWEPAKVGHRAAYMLPLPEGYIPVRFDDDGAKLLVHRDRIRVGP